MFEVVRWAGPAAEAVQPKASEGILTLQQLNARARERAERRRIQAAAAAGGEAAPRIPGSKVSLPSSAVQISSAGEVGGAGGREDVKQVSQRKEKKRKKRDEIPEEEVNEAPPVPHSESPVKKIKRKKKKTRVEEGLESPNENALLEILAQKSRVDEVSKLDNAEASPIEKRRKKKRKTTEQEPSREVRIGGTANNEGEPPALSEVSASILSALYANGNASDAEHQDLSEKGDVDAADDTAKVKQKKKKKREVDTETVDARDDHLADVRDQPMRDSTLEMRAEEGKELEFDLARIEKDVEMIMGKPPGKVAAEGQGKGPPVLPWMRDPLEIGSRKAQPLHQVPGLDPRLQAALTNTGIEALFPVQVAVWNETVGPGNCERDLCVCSPTGSGKTLAYALPIVQKLATRILRRLRALIVLPTRDLATQVKSVFDTIAPAVNLKVGLAVGQTSIIAEAAELVSFQKKMVHSFGSNEASDDDCADSCIDILVATPGRLMDHLRNTKGFTLQHLYYLVVDETDRLLRQSYQDWLSNVLNTVAATESENRLFSLPRATSKGDIVRSIRTIRHLGRERGMRSTVHPRLMKMVLSATITRDPSKIAQLALHCPMYVAQSATENRYQLPEQLEAFKLVCQPGEKPLYLVALLEQLVGQQTIVFTASVVATHRLFTLLRFFEGLSFKVVEYSSLQHQQARSKSLAKFRDGEVQVLIASDAMTRGMDVEGVGNVVNYDMPVYAKTYVHRVGRTARAGRAGCSYTMLRREEVRHFKSLLKKADNSSCKDYSLPASAKELLYERYLKALEKLKEVTVEESGSTPVLAGKDSKGQVLTAEQNGTGPDELFM